MLATLASVLVTTIGIGHIDRHGNVPHSTAVTVRGGELSMSVPPRTQVLARSRCNWLEDPRVEVAIGTDAQRMPRGHWEEDHTAIWFGRVRFDGISFDNFSNRWANIDAHIFNGCKATH